MPENTKGPPRTPDVRTIHYLVRLMQRYDLTAIDLVEGETQIRLRRRSEAAPSATTAASAPALPVHAPASPGPLPALPASGPTEPSPPAGTFIESPMVGTFYSSSAPDAPPYVNVGSVVRPETTVCVIEAMKVFTEIPAGLSGTIAEVLVQNGQPVEFGQHLFRVT